MFGRIKHPVPWRCLSSLVAGLLVAVPPAGASPTWFARTWQSDAGLPDNTVMGIDQAPDGFLWVVTHTGLVRFDGVQFRQFPLMAGGTPAGIIKAMTADRRGRLWVAMGRRTMVCVDPGRPNTVFNLEEGQADKGTCQIVGDTEGAVWVSYSCGEVFRIQDGQASLFTTEDGLPEGGDCQLTVDVAGRLWFARSGWQGVFRDGKFHTLEQSGVTRITAARSGGIWGYSKEQLRKYTEGGASQKSLIPPPEALAGASPTVMLEDSAGRLLIGTSEAGLFSWDGKDIAAVPTAHQTILSLKEDRGGNLWVGTRGGGLNQLKPKLVELLATGSGTSFEAVRSVCLDKAGLLWSVVWQKGQVMRSAGQAWTPLSAKDGWSVSNAQCVAADPHGGVWIGTEYFGLYHWQDGVVSENLKGLPSGRINALLATAAGELWIGTGFTEEPRHCLQRHKAGHLHDFNLPSGSGPVVVLAQDAAGDCWATTANGWLLRVRGDVLTDETRRIPADWGAARCLQGTPDGTLWLGFGGQGLGWLKDGRFNHCRMDQGLHDDYISQILTDGHGRLWCAGNRGIFSVREKDLNDLAAGRATQVRSVTYGHNDGLPGLQASHDSWPGAQRGADGRLVFATQSGMVVVHADDIKENPDPPPVVIEEVTVNGKTAAAYGAHRSPAATASSMPCELRGYGTRLRLPPGRRQVEFVYTALDLTKPEGIRFKYRLRDLDADWVEAGTRRTATYAQIPPGRYRFEVSASNSDGVWNPTGAALDLTAEPFWWETAWFRVAGPLSAAGLLGGWILIWLGRRHRHQIERLEMLRATERERVRIARDLHDDLGGGLTEIAMLSEVAREEGDDPRALDAHLKRIFLSSREMAQALDEIVWAVNPANDSLESLIAFASEFAREILVPAGIRYRLDVAAEVAELDLNSQIRHHLCMALKESLHNIVKHAHACEVQVRIGLDHRTIRIVVEDDGLGFDPAALPRQTGTHNGLPNLHQRMAAIGGRCEIQSAPAKGTRILLETRI